jgi:branched-chain amino acid transport system substrate-binding protein
MRPCSPALALSLLLAGCSSPAAAPAGNTVKIGIDLPLSGAEAAVGQPIANGALLAIEQANAAGFAGGKFKVEADTLDDTTQGLHDPAQGAQNVKTLIGDPAALALVGPYNSNVAKSEIPLTNDAQLAQISPAATADVLTIGAGAKTLRQSHPDQVAFFRTCTRDSEQGAALAHFAQTLHLRRVFIVDDNETYGLDLADAFASSAASDGLTVLGHEHLAAHQQDFKSLLTKIAAAHPDLVFFGGVTTTGGALLRRQMPDAGLGTVPYFGGDGIASDDFLKTAGAAADGTYWTIAAPDVNRLASARTFIADYRKRFNAEPIGYSAAAYTAARIALAAIAKGIGSDGTLPSRATVTANVAATKGFASPIGSVGFDANGDTTAPVLTLQNVKAGKVVTVDVYTVK